MYYYLHQDCPLVARLKSKFSPELDTVFFVNSGSEANDLAVRLARVYTKKYVAAALHAICIMSNHAQGFCLYIITSHAKPHAIT